MNKNAILEKHKLKEINRIKDDIVLCEQSGNKIVLKMNVSTYNNQKAKEYLEHVNKLKTDYIIFPKYLYVSDENDYIIMSYEEGVEPPWSEHDEMFDIWGGKNISMEYLNMVISIMEDLKKIDITELLKNEKESWLQKLDYAINSNDLINQEKSDLKWYSTEIPNLKEIDNLLNNMVEYSYINKELKDEIYNLLKENYKLFFLGKVLISNFDFYPRNLLKTENKKIVMVDWDRIGFEVKERMFMTFWVHMFGNKEIQEKLVTYYKQDKDFDVVRYRIGLILILLEQIDLWWNTKKSNKAFSVCVEYLINYKLILSV